MRRDYCFFAPCDVKKLFDSYFQAIRALLDPAATGTPYYKIKCGLSFSWKYGINGGGCAVHFMPVDGGSAVNVRYILAQACGARCDAHIKYLNDEVVKYLGVYPSRCFINPKDFST